MPSSYQAQVFPVLDPTAVSSWTDLLSPRTVSHSLPFPFQKFPTNWYTRSALQRVSQFSNAEPEHKGFLAPVTPGRRMRDRWTLPRALAPSGGSDWLVLFITTPAPSAGFYTAGSLHNILWTKSFPVKLPPAPFLLSDPSSPGTIPSLIL